jgi:kynureninase
MTDAAPAFFTLEAARALDAADPLAARRAEFHFPKRSVVLGGAAPSAGSGGDDSFVYLCGHSLGLQHVGVEAALQAELAKWRDQAVEGHFLAPNPWFEVDNVLRADMASLVGARESETVVMNSLTANLHLLLARFYQPAGARTKILCERFPFPSDMHALVSVVRNRGLAADQVVEIAAAPASAADRSSASASASSAPEFVLTTATLLAALREHGSTTAVLLLSAVHFLSGQFFDLAAVTAAAHAEGVLVGVDCAHAAGNVPLQLHDWGVDFACWCTYKYLNGGPGNIGALFVHDRHRSDDPRALHGWWGHKVSNRFALHREFDACDGAASMQLSNPSVVSMMSLAPSIRCMAAVGMPALRAKSLSLTAYLERLLAHHRLTERALSLLTPADPASRGAMLTFAISAGAIRADLAADEARHSSYENGTNLNNDADMLQRLLLKRGVMSDNRPPNIVRITPAPLYNSFEDVWRLVDVLKDILVV